MVLGSKVHNRRRSANIFQKCQHRGECNSFSYEMYLKKNTKDSNYEGDFPTDNHSFKVSFLLKRRK